MQKTSIESWVEKQLAFGKYHFSADALFKEFSDRSHIANKFGLHRLVDKGKVLSLHKGFYLVLPPQYASRSILPPPLFLDDFMRFLARPYYVSLLSAAVFHGATHQQPQEYFVNTNYPAMRPTRKNGLILNYVSIKNFSSTFIESFIEQRKTEVGYLSISNPILTATDLIFYEKRVGGLNRVAMVLSELAENLSPSHFNKVLLEFVPTSTLQRLGYLLEFVCEEMFLADVLWSILTENDIQLFRIPLKASLPSSGFSATNRWNVVVNTEIEVEI